MENMEKINGKIILVTGGTGFIGSNLVEELLKKGAEIIIPYVRIDPRSKFSTQNIFRKVKLERVDIKNRKKILLLPEKYNIDYIFHLAAQTLVTEAYENPFNTLETNIMGTVALLESVRVHANIKGLIIASSDKAYGKTKRKYTEEFPLKGDHPYDVSKSSADLIAQTYFNTYKIPVVITRFGNVYGEGDLHFDRIIPAVCKAIIEKKPLKIRSNGQYVRDYIYVKDVVNGYITLLKKINKTLGQAYNFSSRDTLSVIDLIKKSEKILGLKIPYVILNNAKNEIPYQHLDDSKIRRLGWKTECNLESSLKKTFLWYKKTLVK